MWESVLDGVLDDLDLHGDGRQHGLLQTVELIKAAPCSTLDQTDEDTAHRLHIYTLTTVEIGLLVSFNTD